MEVLLYRKQIVCWFPAIKGATCVGVLLYKEQIGCGIEALKEAIFVGVQM